MMTDNMKFKGRLLSLEQDARAYKLRIAGLVRSLRDLLDPFEPPEDLQGEMIAGQGVSLASAQIEYLAVMAEIKAVKKALES